MEVDLTLRCCIIRYTLYQSATSLYQSATSFIQDSNNPLCLCVKSCHATILGISSWSNIQLQSNNSILPTAWPWSNLSRENDDLSEGSPISGRLPVRLLKHETLTSRVFLSSFLPSLLSCYLYSLSAQLRCGSFCGLDISGRKHLSSKRDSSIDFISW